MLEYLEGIWTGAGSSDYYIIRDGEVYTVFSHYFEETLHGCIDSAIERDPSSFKTLTAADCVVDLNEILGRILANDARLLASIKHRRGTFTVGDKDNYWVITEKGLEIPKANRVLKKVSETPEFQAEILSDFFVKAMTSYEPELSSFLLSPKDYAYLIRERYPEIENYRLAFQDEGTVIYSDNGKTNANEHSRSWMYTDGMAMITDKREGYRYTAAYTDEHIMITSGAWADVETLLRDALACLGEYPHALTVDEVKELYDRNAEDTKYGLRLDHTQNGIQYYVRIAEDNAKEILISW